MDILWVKPGYTFARKRLIGFPSRARKAVETMVASVTSRQSPVLMYIATTAGPEFGWADYRGLIAGLAYVAPLGAGKSVDDYPFDKQWAIGVPVAQWLRYPTPSLNLGQWVTNTSGAKAWGDMAASFQTGAHSISARKGTRLSRTLLTGPSHV